MKTITLIWTACFAAVSPAVTAEPPNVRCTLTVVTPDGVPVPNARVGIAGGLSTPDGKYERNPKGYTDEHGGFVAILASTYGQISASARLDGFYESELRGARLDGNGETAWAANTRGRWEPWDRSFTLILKPIRNPVAMYAKRVVTDIPAGREWIGFDLQIGDWVPPYGNGSERDLEFLSECAVREFRYDYDGVLTVRFPNRGDGIQPLVYDPGSGSELRFPYQAPSDGYIGEFSWRSGRTPPSSRHGPSPIVDESNPQRAFIYRVRTVLDEEGNVISARYGKIPGPFIFDARGEHRAGFVNFTYYFNPDRTRNLEFDPKQNLFPGEPVLSP